jgi:hypothetical protein
MLLGGYALRVTEMHYDGRFYDLENCIWFTLIAMATVGYGDLYVYTNWGILIDTTLMYTGIVIMSLLVSSLTGLFSMTYSML